MNTNDIAVGDVVHASFGRYGEIDVRTGTVLRKTPTGQIVVSFGEGRGNSTFMQNGHEKGMGHSWSTGAFLIDEAGYNLLRVIMLKINAARKINAAVKEAPQLDRDHSNLADVIAAIDAIAAKLRFLKG